MSRDWHARRKPLAYSPVFACVGTLVSSFHEATRSQATLHPQPVAVGAALLGRTSRRLSARDDTLEWNIIMRIRFDHSTALQRLLPAAAPVRCAASSAVLVVGRLPWDVGCVSVYIPASRCEAKPHVQATMAAKQLPVQCSGSCSCCVLRPWLGANVVLLPARVATACVPESWGIVHSRVGAQSVLIDFTHDSL